MAKILFALLPMIFIIVDYKERSLFANARRYHDSPVHKNQVMHTPQVSCGHDGIVFEMETAQPFTGELYVNNEYKNPSCRADFSNVGTNSGSMKLDFNACGMRRQRVINPRGMTYTVTVMVKFHPIFVTQMDKAYQVRCFFREHEANISADMTVSPLTTMSMESDYPLPQCSYSIRVGSADGPPASFVRVGDSIVHVFNCTKSDNLYSLLVKDCVVDDGKKFRQQLIDDIGCPVDRNLIQVPDYSQKNTQAIAEATVFKWPDEPNIYFSCQILLCMKEGAMCEGIRTPPVCGHSTRRKRSAVISPDMNRFQRFFVRNSSATMTTATRLLRRLSHKSATSSPTETFTDAAIVGTTTDVERGTRKGQQGIEFDLEVKKLTVFDVNDNDYPFERVTKTVTTVEPSSGETTADYANSDHMRKSHVPKIRESVHGILAAPPPFSLAPLVRRRPPLFIKTTTTPLFATHGTTQKPSTRANRMQLNTVKLTTLIPSTRQTSTEESASLTRERLATERSLSDAVTTTFQTVAEFQTGTERIEAPSADLEQFNDDAGAHQAGAPNSTTFETEEPSMAEQGEVTVTTSRPYSSNNDSTNVTAAPTTTSDKATLQSMPITIDTTASKARSGNVSYANVTASKVRSFRPPTTISSRSPGTPEPQVEQKVSLLNPGKFSTGPNTGYTPSPEFGRSSSIVVKETQENGIGSEAIAVFATLLTVICSVLLLVSIRLCMLLLANKPNGLRRSESISSSIHKNHGIQPPCYYENPNNSPVQFSYNVKNVVPQSMINARMLGQGYINVI